MTRQLKQEEAAAPAKAAAAKPAALPLLQKPVPVNERIEIKSKPGNLLPGFFFYFRSDSWY